MARDNPIFLLAPMDGMTRASFRRICFDYGADGATTEMIQSLALGRARKRLSDTFAETMVRYPNEKYLAAQLIGSHPAMMAESARRLTAMNRFDAIDINMGCPARKVVGSGNGSALLRTPEKAIAVMAAVRAATDLPVQLKLRLGWDETQITAPQLAKEAEALGLQSLTIHGRTRQQMYTGPVDVAAIREICRSVRIPVYANGGVACAQDALAFLQATEAAGVAIGRAALKQPWIFDDIRRLRMGKAVPERLAPERVALLQKLARLACGHRPEKVAVSEMRKFCGWLLPGFTGAEEVLAKLNGIVTLDGYNRLLDNWLERLVRENDLARHVGRMTPESLDTCRYRQSGSNDR